MIIIACAFIALLWLLMQWTSQPYHEEISLDNFKGTMIKYRIQVICNNVVLAKTFSGDSQSEILDKLMEYSIKEAGDLPDIILIRKDVIYL